MKKNVTILDILGNIVGTTYPKRAKGLIKSGRACVVDGETVQLTCPPKQYRIKQQEDIDMEIEIEKEEQVEKKSDLFTATATEIMQEKEEILETEKKESNESNLEKVKKLLDAGISLKDILHNLDTIQADSSYIKQALNNLEKLPYITPMADAPIDTSIAARAEAIADIVKCRETTNQMMIKLYTQLYTDYMA